MTSTLSTAPTTRSKSRKTFKSPCSCLNSDCSFVVLLLFTLGFNFIIYVFSLFSFSFMCLHQLSFSLNCIFLACIHQIFMFKCVFCSFTHLFFLFTLYLLFVLTCCFCLHLFFLFPSSFFPFTLDFCFTPGFVYLHLSSGCLDLLPLCVDLHIIFFV